ncbi:hypothetical protein TNCV_4806121 [Trichonephila clavipes]|nr:hypothetical protein TNCV_4806121 [Trichonephila clavipes]
MDVCKCKVPSRHGGIRNSRRAASPLMMFMEGEEGWETPDPHPGCPPSKLGWNRAKSYCLQYGSQGYGRRQACI